MTIKKAALIGLFALVPAMAFATPDPITDLQATTGSNSGEVDLQWTARTDGTTAAATRYVIKYRYNNTIVTAADWSAATRIGDAPVNQSEPTPSAPGNVQPFTVRNLEPGVTYGWAIRAYDAADVESTGSNSPTATAKDVCTRQPDDGQLVASAGLVPSTLFAGQVTQTTMTVVIAGPGISTGGKIALRVPDYWPRPSTTTVNAPGYTSFAVTGGASLALSFDNQTIVLTVLAGSLTSGNTVTFYYLTQTCDIYGGIRHFALLTQGAACGVLTETAYSQTMTTVAGPPQFVDFDYFDLPVRVSSVTPVNLRVVDQCRNTVPLTSTVTISVSAKLQDNLLGLTTDPLALLSSSPSFVVSTPTLSLTIPGGGSSSIVYYRVNASTNRPNDRIMVSHLTFQPPTFLVSRLAFVRPLDDDIRNASVDTGSPSATIQKTVAFSPDGDGTDDAAFINFSLSEAAPWQIDLSSNGFASVVRRFSGNSVTARVSWDGYSDGQPGVPPGIAPPGSYAARISLGGGTMIDTSLTINLQAFGMTGVVVDEVSAPLSNVDVQIFGPSNRYARTDATGGFTVYGLKAGTYQVRFNKTGYAQIEITRVVTSGVLNVGTVTVPKESVLKLEVSRPAADDMPELWGQVRANNSDWSKQAWGTVHFRRGHTDGDAGDIYNVSPTTYTPLTLTPSVQYRIHFDVPNLSTGDFNVTLGANEERFYPIPLTRRANILGTVNLPSGSNPSGLWVSVEVGADANLDGIYDSQDGSLRQYGGAWLGPNETRATYRVFGIANGSFTVTANAPNFVSIRQPAVVSNANDVTVDFPAFSVGGVIVGTITVNGDSGPLGQGGPTFIVPINAGSQALQTGSFKQVTLSTNPATTSAPFTMTGLSDGTYDIYANLPGFELVPPGRRTVNVVSGNASLNLTFQPYTGGLTGNITLPGANNDYSNVQITVRSYDFNVGTFSNPSFAGSVYTFGGLGTGFYSVEALYPATGFLVTKSVQIVNGHTSNLNLDLSGNTYSISGTVSTAARPPYDSLSYFVSSSSPTRLYDEFAQGTVVLPANRVQIDLVQDKNTNGGNNNQTADPSHFNSRQTFFAFYDSSGSYSINHLSPGTYRVHANTEIDNNYTDGPEVSASSLIVKVLTGATTGQDVNLSDGFDVSGTLRLASDDAALGRTLSLSLKNASGVTVAQTNVLANAAAVSFTMQRVPSGDYILSAEDLGYPRAIAAKSVRVVVDNAAATGIIVDVLKAAKIQGQFRLKNSSILLTSRNFDQYISGNFHIEARANPWFSGGSSRAVDPLIDADGKFNIPLNPGKYDVYFQADQSLGAADLSQGKKQFVQFRISGIEVTAGQTYDLGGVELTEGSVVKGTVRNKSGAPLANVVVAAIPSDHRRDFDPLQAVTNDRGEYALQGIDSSGIRFYDIIAAPRPSGDDSRFTDFTGTLYGEIRRTQIDTRLTTPIDFVIEPALGVVHGRATTPDGGEIDTPFGDFPKPGAEIIMNKIGNIPQDNPLGDIDVVSKPDGTFDVRGLTPGAYNLWALASGYGSGFVKNIVVGNGTTDIGTVTLLTGKKISGGLFRADGSRPNSQDLGALVAVRNGFEEILVGELSEDAENNVTGYKISGFQPDKAYTILAFDKGDKALVLADNLVVNNDTTRDLTLLGKSPSVLTTYSKNTDGTLTIQYEFTDPLRNSAIDLDANGIPDDSDPAHVIALKNSSGTITYPSDWLSFDRRRARISYAPAAGEVRFTLTVTAVFDTINAGTGSNFAKTIDFQYFLGIGRQKQKTISNAGGGSVGLDEDTSEFTAQAGTFGSTIDSDIDVVFRVADTIQNLNSTAGQAPISRAMTMANQLGLGAYPPDMSAAIQKAKTAEVNPFSSFYDIFLPAGVNHFFPQGKEARLCVAYDSSAPDPYSLNVYYYNTATNEYVLQSSNKTVDTDNRRICVSLSHASVFTVLNSSASIISGAGYTGELNVLNFPNPFDLKSKTVTLQNPGSAAATQQINGTMIKISVPPSLSGAFEIEIFSVTGEKVRTIDGNFPTGGAHYYFEWDGTNDHGSKVGSGIYVARLTIGSGNEKFFKMAVVK